MRLWTATLLVLWVGLAVAMRPTKTYERAMTEALHAEEDWLLCRAQNASQRLRDIGCFNQALARHPYNATWWKQLGALLEMSGMPATAAAAYNRSAYTILEAQAFVGPLAKTEGLSRVTMLKLYRRREPEGSYELAKAWYMAMVLKHQLSQARTLLADFMDLLYPDDRTVQYRAIGSMWDVAKFRTLGLKGAARCQVCFFAEELPFAVELWSQRMLMAPLVADAASRAELQNYTKVFCGKPLPYEERYLARDLMSFLMLCAARTGDFDSTIKSDGELALSKGYLALDRTVVHHLASLGADRPLRTIAQLFPAALSKTDNFGRTALHYAAAHRQAATFAMLAKLGANPHHKDAGGATPSAVACANMRNAFLAVAPPGACDGALPIVERIQDDEDDECDRSGGGWSIRKFEPSCTLDIRTADGISHDTLVAEFLLNSKPVVLRGGVTRKVQDLLQKAKLMDDTILLRVEDVPASELYGINVTSQNTSLAAFSTVRSPQFGTVEVTDKHPLYRRVRAIPRSVVLDGNSGYTTTKGTFPLFVVANAEATTNHVFTDSHVVQFVAHGVQQWVLHPPTVAFTSRGRMMLNVSQGETAERCTLMAGDALIVPSLWAYAWTSLGESISFSRKFYWR